MCFYKSLFVTLILKKSPVHICLFDTLNRVLIFKNAIENVGLQVGKNRQSISPRHASSNSSRQKTITTVSCHLCEKHLNKMAMACNFNCTQLFSLHLKGSILTANVLTLIHKQINNEMFFTTCHWFHSIWHKRTCIYTELHWNILLPWCLPFPFFLL